MNFNETLENIKKRIGIFNPNNLFTDDAKQLIAEKNEYQSFPVKCNNNVNNKLPSTDLELFEQAKIRFLTEQLREQKNLNQIYKKTEENTKKQIIDKSSYHFNPIDEDWLTHYLECASKVSNEQMQNLWAKLLAGEIVNPKTFSKRTIDVLLLMNTEEAKLFEKISEYILSFGSNKAILRDTEFYTKFNLQYSDIMNLGECGLINPSGLINMTFNKRAIIIHYGNKVIIGNMPSDKSIKLDVFPLTTSGIELYSIIKAKINDPYIVAIKEYLEKKYNDVSFEISSF